MSDRTAMKSKSSIQLPPEVLEFAEQVGSFIEYWGFKKVQGEIWAHLYLSNKPLDRTELMARTGISKGLASIYLNEMLEYSVILESGKASHGTVLYVANPDQETVILNVLRKRERKMLAQIKASVSLCELLPENELDKTDLSGDRIKSVSNMILQAEVLMDLFLRRNDSVSSLIDQMGKS